MGNEQEDNNKAKGRMESGRVWAVLVGMFCGVIAYLWGAYGLGSAAYEFLKVPIGFKGDATFLDAVMNPNIWMPFGLLLLARFLISWGKIGE
ncbi:MAG: hypothetical protein A3G20_08865 [Acidobacteria bacterium RIFCSPLOWO2_12_FULL_59_11]|nr:MAG: hypothetical protein A3G20_08865 [Acidobacteria bacterium RIFCSPLOWO2_12_FULL_59_11]